jgi:hypothetical protein
MTLAPETGEVSWASMGLQRVLLLAEVLLIFVEVPGFSTGSGGLLVSELNRAWPLRPSRDVPAPGPIQLVGSRWFASRRAASLGCAPLWGLLLRHGRRSAPVTNLIILTSESPPS